MKTNQVANLLLLASSVLAAPSKLQEARHERLAKRMAARQHNRPLAVNATSLEDTIIIEPSEAHVTYTSNWAGAAQYGSKVTQVTGTFTIPTVKKPSGGSNNQQYGASAWVGIDGNTCDTAILQTGVDLLVEGTETAYEAWYEWYPDYSYTFSGFAVKPGDSIRATVVATSTTAGTAKIENLTTGKSTTHSFSNEGSTGTLCQNDAEWIVEDFESGDSLVPFANFDAVTFTSASYINNGATEGVSGATIIDVKQDGTVYSKCGTSGTSSVYCDYV